VQIATPNCCQGIADCDDVNPCTKDICFDNACYNTPQAGTDCCINDAQCEDGNQCTVDVCGATGTCENVPGPPIFGAEEVCGDGLDNDCNPQTVCFELVQGNTKTPIEPVEGDQGVVSFYSYKFVHNFSADTGYEVEDHAALLLYKDPWGNVAMLFILDEVDEEENQPDGGEMALSFTGAQGMDILVYDDIPQEGGNDEWSFDSKLGEGNIHWWWSGCCTDGFALGYLSGDFCIDLDPTAYSGIQNIAFWNTPNAYKAISANTPFSLCSTQ
jgi:hypothetical protein